MKHSEFRYQNGFWLIVVLFAFQLGCGSQTPQEQARDVLIEAADAMGGLEALASIQNISREGQSKRSSLGQGHVTTERLLVGRLSPFKQWIDFTVPRELGLSGSREIPTVADWEKGGYR
ncbi:MAG: hypothetical protein V3S50_01710, partial [Acidobacteriota bacterium]